MDRVGKMDFHEKRTRREDARKSGTRSYVRSISCENLRERGKLVILVLEFGHFFRREN